MATLKALVFILIYLYNDTVNLQVSAPLLANLQNLTIKARDLKWPKRSLKKFL